MYIPLQFCRNFELPKGSSNQFVKACREIIELGQTDRLLHFINSNPGFMKPSYAGEHKGFNDICLKYREQILSALGKFSKEEIQNDLWNDIVLRQATMSDICMPYFIMDKWAASKQIYCYDPEMELALADTEEIRFDPAVFDRMPYKTIYIEFSPEGILSSHYHGAFIHVAKAGSNYDVLMIRVKHNMAYHTGNMLCTDDIQGSKIIVNRDTDCLSKGEIADDWGEFSMFVLNALLYLCAVNNEVSENPYTAKTYKPSASIKNKFSEIRKWNVGVRYGAAVRARKTAVPADNKKTVPHPMPSVRPHMRRAHWHHYRVGKGKIDMILKWIEPIFVGSGSIPAVKHNVCSNEIETSL